MISIADDKRTIQITDSCGLRAHILAGHGGIPDKITLIKGGKAIPVFQGFADADEEAKLFYSKGVKLVPFPNRIRDGKYSFQGKTYQLAINKPNENNAIHGLLQKVAYEITDCVKEDDRYAITLSHTYQGEDSGYPFPFRISIIYTLSGVEFTARTIVENTGTNDMPFGDGWHPYLTIHDRKIDELLLKLPSQQYLGVDERLIPDEAIHQLDKFATLEKINDQLFDTGFVLPDTSTAGIAESILSSPEDDITLTLWQETGPGKYNFLQVFIPPWRNTIALEPMTCAANAFNNGMGTFCLKPGESFDASYGVRIS